MSTLDDAYEAAMAAWNEGLDHRRQAEATVRAFLAHLADNPPEEMVEALEDPVPYASGWVDGKPRPWREWQAEAALRSIIRVKTNA